MTKQQTLHNALCTLGWTLKEKRPHYWIMQLSTKEPFEYVFLGPAGAMRKGKTFTTSISLTDGKVYRMLLEQGCSATALGL